MPTFDDVRAIGQTLPGVEESTSYGTPALRVGGKFLVRLREEGVLVIRADLMERAALLESEPDVYFITPHYEGSDAFLIRLDLVDLDQLRELITERWRDVAPKRVVAAFDADPDPQVDSA